MKLSDTHCHLDLYPDPFAIVAAVERAQVRTIAVTNAPSVYVRSSELTDGCTYLRTALGFHPQLAVQRRGEIELFRAHAGSAKYIGEVGLDFTTADASERQIQREIFDQILAACAAGGKLLTVHSRRAAAETVDAIGDRFRSTVILHWYSGALGVLDRAATFGFYFSVNTAMLQSKSGERVIRALPRERVLLESDGPFAQVENRAATPLDGRVVVHGLANIWRITAFEAADQINSNFIRALTTTNNSATQNNGAENRPH